MSEALVIETPRLIIRDFAITDWPEVHQYSSDPEVVRYLNWGPNCEADTIGFVLTAISAQHEDPRTQYHLAVVRKEDDRLIGSCAIGLSGCAAGNAWVGYVLNKEFWGQSYATEALSGLLEFAFETLRKEKISATCDVRNVASQRVLEKSGFTRERLIERHVMQKGEWRDSFVYGITARESVATHGIGL